MGDLIYMKGTARLFHAKLMAMSSQIAGCQVCI